MAKSNLTIKEKVLSTFEGKEGQIFQRHEIINMVLKNYPGTKKGSVIPSDYCYNITNDGIKFDFHIFIWKLKGIYEYLGPKIKYDGLIYWKGSEWGKWEKGNWIKF